MRLFKFVTALFACLALGSFATSAQAYAPLQMGIHDPHASGADPTRFDAIRDSRADLTRLTLYWAQIVPDEFSKPAGMDARNPADPSYNLAGVDAFVRAAADRGVEPFITTLQAPGWAEGDDEADRSQRQGDRGTYNPNAKEYGDFIFALATRYSGTFPDPERPGQNLPRVRYWQMWNEPNFGQYLSGQKQADIPIHYARLLNAGYDAVKSVHSSNVVMAAGLGPYGNNGHATDLEPQEFMRTMLCLTGRGGDNLKKMSKCAAPKVKFDVWTQHPYTFGGDPSTPGTSPDSAAIGNMPDIKRTLAFAIKKKTILPAGRKKLWISEFAWFSNPPGIKSGDGRELGVPLSRHAAYLSESAYKLWKLGFSAFVWYGLDDEQDFPFPSGLYQGKFPDVKAKPALEAFRFPFYTEFRRGGTVLVWGLASKAGKTTIRVEKKSGKRWKKVADVKTDGQGMIYKKLKGSKGTYRGRVLTGPEKDLASRSFAGKTSNRR